MKKYRIKERVWKYGCVVQVREWYGWVTIKTFKSNSIAPDCVNYAWELASELLDKLEE